MDYSQPRGQLAMSGGRKGAAGKFRVDWSLFYFRAEPLCYGACPGPRTYVIHPLGGHSESSLRLARTQSAQLCTACPSTQRQ